MPRAAARMKPPVIDVPIAPVDAVAIDPLSGFDIPAGTGLSPKLASPNHWFMLINAAKSQSPGVTVSGEITPLVVAG